MKTNAEIINAFRAKYEALRPSFPQIGPFESHRMSRLGDIRVCDLGKDGKAAFAMDATDNVVEVHGGIYDVWKGNGGAIGPLGFPVKDEDDYHGPDARPGDRFSEFENGSIVWRADTWETEIRMFRRCHEIVRQFGVGINLGNSLDAPDGETAWGNPMISRDILRLYRNEGFRTVRVPVTWNKHSDAVGLVDPAFMDRVREVIGWCLDEDFTTILNLHHEDGWLSPAFDESAMQRFTGLWTQIAKRFADCGERLVFEAFNEIRNGDDWQGTDEAFKAVNHLAAKFVETIRASGGINAERYLMIPTYAASAGEPACRGWKEIGGNERLIATVHCYAPHEFTHQAAGKKEYHPDWCKPALEAVFDCLKRNFLDHDIPVVIGEAGVKQVDGCPCEEGRIAWAQDLAGLASRNEIPIIVWEDGGGFQLVDRHRACWTHLDLARAYLNETIRSS